MADITSVLNDLVETSKDGEQGFRTAAEDTRDPTLRELFLNRAQDCAKGAQQLQQIVVRMGGRAEEDGSIAGTLHRGWVKARSAVAARDEVAILEECERGEDVAKARYRDALEDDALPEDIRAIVRHQYDGVVRNHDEIRALRDRYRSAQQRGS